MAQPAQVVRIGVPLTSDAWPKLIAQAGGQLTQIETHGQAEVIAATAKADVIINAGAQFPAEVINQLEHCRLLIQSSVGFDRIDVPAATAKGIMIANLPDYCIEEVAEHAITLVLATARRLRIMEQLVRDGTWNAGPYQRMREQVGPVQRLSTTTFGIIGFGKIGRLVARKASGMGWTILAADPFIKADAAAALGVQLVSLDDLLKRSDFITLHVLLSPETKGLIGPRELGLMKKGAILVNTCRGPIVNEAALTAALASGHLGGAGLDVFEHEPLAMDSGLRTFDNVLLTPHMAVYSEHAMANWEREPFDDAARVLQGIWPRGLVNRELKATLTGFREA